MSFEIFGYRDDDRLRPAFGIQVAEGKNRETLAPVVVLYIRETEDSDQVGYVLPLEMAAALSDELSLWVQRARQKHWE